VYAPPILGACVEASIGAGNVVIFVYHLYSCMIYKGCQCKVVL
jgi:hypothetical protein